MPLDQLLFKTLNTFNIMHNSTSTMQMYIDTIVPGCICHCFPLVWLFTGFQLVQYWLFTRTKLWSVVHWYLYVLHLRLSCLSASWSLLKCMLNKCVRSWYLKLHGNCAFLKLPRYGEVWHMKNTSFSLQYFKCVLGWECLQQACHASQELPQAWNALLWLSPNLRRHDICCDDFT